MTSFLTTQHCPTRESRLMLGVILPDTAVPLVKRLLPSFKSCIASSGFTTALPVVRMGSEAMEGGRLLLQANNSACLRPRVWNLRSLGLGVSFSSVQHHVVPPSGMGERPRNSTRPVAK